MAKKYTVTNCNKHQQAMRLFKYTLVSPEGKHICSTRVAHESDDHKVVTAYVAVLAAMQFPMEKGDTIYPTRGGILIELCKERPGNREFQYRADKIFEESPDEKCVRIPLSTIVLPVDEKEIKKKPTKRKAQPITKTPNAPTTTN